MAQRASIALFAALFASALFSAETISPEDAKFFETKIRPLLADNCWKCHGADKQKGALRLDSREALLKGGDYGTPVLFEKPEASLLIVAVSHKDPDLKMPPKSDKLPAADIDALTDWIKRGLPWPASFAGKALRKEKTITAEDRAFWSFQPVKTAAAADSEIDRFVSEKLAKEGLSLAPEADRRTLGRRVWFDLTGLPPKPDELDAFVNDAAPDAYSKLIDRLLASPQYGERWARMWLDLVRYSESDGFKQDSYRPHVWPYRDYVIRAFNDDKPYDRFVQEQLAGDEIDPENPDVLVATTFLRLTMYEYNQRNVPGQYHEIRNDITDVTGDVFLGLSISCARCHDHKFDPILQADYFRLKSFFTPITARDDLVLAAPKQAAEYREKFAIWEEKTKDLRAQIEAIEKPTCDAVGKPAIEKFPPDTQELFKKPLNDLTPYERQLYELANLQVLYEHTLIDGKIKGADREKWSSLKRKLSEFDSLKPAPLKPAFVATDIGPVAPQTLVPSNPPREVEPAFLAVLGGEVPKIEKPACAPNSTGRRLALATWLTRPDNPLTARVLVNRVWQSHFGRGIVGTSSEFGKLGEKPTHPELLDSLAADFVKNGWSIKQLHRKVMLSAAYRQTAMRPTPEIAKVKDPDNRWLWKMNSRRLDAEQIRDSMLFASGELQTKPGGLSVDGNSPRRSVYVKVFKNAPDPFLNAFDAADGVSSSPSRNVTTTATQSLLMINGQWPLARAAAFAKLLRADKNAAPEKIVEDAYRIAYGRLPRYNERAAAVKFLNEGGLNQEPQAASAPLLQPMPHRGGQALFVRSGKIEDALTLPAFDVPSAPPERADFTVEAVVQLESVYENASVRVIASQWDGSPQHYGWSLGVTGEKSKYQPLNLVLQIVGKTDTTETFYDVIASDLRIDLHKPHYLAVSVRIADIGELGVTFYMQDLSDPDAPLRTASVKHAVSKNLTSTAKLMIGGRTGPQPMTWDGLIDEVRISNTALPKEMLLLFDGDNNKSIIANWKFEAQPGVFKDSSSKQRDLSKLQTEMKKDKVDAALIDFCHVLLNSNEFLYVD